jgi:hypothetical protein
MVFWKNVLRIFDRYMIVVRGILDTANTHSLDLSFSRVATDTPIKCDGVKLV